MIDIHSHVLPGVDDGAYDLSDALEMLRAAQNAGVSVIAATPHVHNPSSEDSTREYAASLEELRRASQAEGLSIKLFQGAELVMEPGIAEIIAHEPQLTLGGAGEYVLMEFPLFRFPRYAPTLVLEMKIKCLIPVIAHPERCWDIAENFDLARGLAENRALFQINAGSLLGLHGRSAETSAKAFLQAGLAHFLASDAHRPESFQLLSEARIRVEKDFGPEAARSMTQDLPARAIGYRHENS